MYWTGGSPASNGTQWGRGWDPGDGGGECRWWQWGNPEIRATVVGEEEDIVVDAWADTGARAKML